LDEGLGLRELYYQAVIDRDELAPASTAEQSAAGTNPAVSHGGATMNGA
jgi:hypothetical protein